MLRMLSIIVLVLMFPGASIAALFTDRANFENQLDVFVTDDYNQTLYPDLVYTDADMSAVLGETIYQATGFTDTNLVPDDGGGYYCAGCNGSFLLDFTATSVGGAAGVFGVGFDIYGDENVSGNTAFVTYGDNSTANFTLPDASFGEFPFWGITDNLLISTIHIGLVDGGSNTSNSVRMALDNLTIGSAADVSAVPIPAAIWLFGTALLGFTGLSRKS